MTNADEVRRLVSTARWYMDIGNKDEAVKASEEALRIYNTLSEDDRSRLLIHINLAKSFIPPKKEEPTEKIIKHMEQTIREEVESEIFTKVRERHKINTWNFMPIEHKTNILKQVKLPNKYAKMHWPRIPGKDRRKITPKLNKYILAWRGVVF